MDLRERRVALGMSAGEVATLLGVSPPSVLRWERRARLPGPRDISRLAAVLDVPTDRVAGFFDAARTPSPPRTSVRGPGLRQLRHRRGVTVAALARAAGVGPATVYNWEAGRVRIPAYALPGLAGALGTTVGALRHSLTHSAAAPPRPRTASGLRRLRLQRGLSQQSVAERTGRSRWSIRAWERGEPPPLHALRALADAYDVSVTEVADAAGVRCPPHLDPRNWTPGLLPAVLRTLREWSGLTQAQLADACACSAATVRAWESGRLQPSPALRRRLEEHYGLPSGALVTAYALRRR
ncbi:helix-turn-helix domain-containing protein [Nocardioides sp.]|uniref:helix-turn-helix domain-containing protein n=1 Tax=Nocardioides sp. TaxID=35761 RepID=UPI0027348018|nr:helix-turn-helix domain-containing protein [Nocardioides sp.]MDP3891317.1 helix-turn-helix domain-containing protein [Nocardioides sp.]